MDSQLLSAAGLDGGMLSEGTKGGCRDNESDLDCGGSGELADIDLPLAIRRSSTLWSVEFEEICSNVLSAEPPSATTMSVSDTPRSMSNDRSFLFSSRTFLAALWISVDASIPICSQLRNLASSSCKYSFRRARERPVHPKSVLCSQRANLCMFRM